uniref:Uncharacterized protein n=1 Tax=Biomphalaria glabrata TaxID=6526 RepID=A0A2C9KTY1_BIOGL
NTRTGANSSVTSSQSIVFIGDSPLHIACQKKCLLTVKKLVEELTNLSPKNRFGQTPLHVCVNKEALEITKFLLRYRSTDVDSQDALGQTALMVCCQRKNALIAQELLKAKARHDLTDHLGNMAIHIASSVGAAACLNVLISAGSCINVVNYQNETPLFLAAKHNNLLIIKKILKCKPHVDITSLSGLSAEGVALMSVELIQEYLRDWYQVRKFLQRIELYEGDKKIHPQRKRKNLRKEQLEGKDIQG